MTEDTENLVLEHLRHLRKEMDGLRDDVRDLKFRTNRIEQGQASVEQALAHHSGKLDRIDDRLAHIEKRLNLVEA